MARLSSRTGVSFSSRPRSPFAAGSLVRLSSVMSFTSSGWLEGRRRKAEKWCPGTGMGADPGNGEPEARRPEAPPETPGRNAGAEPLVELGLFGAGALELEE